MKEQHYDGFISSVQLNGKLYGLKLAVVEAYPIRCKNCGSSFELKYGSGKCDCCGTYYTTEFKLVEQSI